MRQSSTDFMNEMLKDNTPVAPKSDNIADLIDERINKAMEKFTEQLNKITIPQQEDNNFNEKENNDHDKQGNEGAGGKGNEGAEDSAN